jgi:hypothetical protein
MSIQQRVDQFTTRLNKLLGTAKLDPKLVTVSRVGADHALSYKGNLIATADRRSAELDGTSTMILARKWAVNLIRVILLAQAKPHNPLHQ